MDAREPEHNETCLMQAIRHGHCHIAKWFLDKGSNLTAANVFESTAVHLASEIDNLECLQDLVSFDETDINMTDAWGYTPLDIAKYKDKRTTYSYLASIGAKCRACCNRRFGVPC